MIKKMKLCLGFCLSAFILILCSLECRAAEEYTDLTEGAEYEEDGVFYHPDGDGILVSDYTLPENMYFGWYNGNLTIASGVTLTIPKGSTFYISPGMDFEFTLEEGATIRIEGEPEVNEWGDPKERLQISFTKAYINGTIESESTGIHSDHNKLYLNGTIHSAQSAVLARECQVFVLGGEYLGGKTPIRNMDPDCQSLIEIQGGVFSGSVDSNYLSRGYTYEKHENGVMVIPISSETETTNADSITIKERITGIMDYATGLFMEAKSDSITEEGSWLNGDIVVVILCVATVVIILLYVIFDFIRSPWKKKLKILLELVIAIGLVGGILWYFRNQAVKEQQKDSINYTSYEEETVPEKVLVQNDASLLKNLEAYPEGIYQVGKDLEPGVYFFESSDPDESDACFYIYFSRKEDFAEKEVGAWTRRCYVELKNGDYIYVQDANFVKCKEQPAYQPDQQGAVITYPKGEYLVGYDIMPGSYQVETQNDIYIRDTAITGAEVNFSIYNQESYVNGDTIDLKEGQYISTGIWGTMTLTRK